MALTNVLLLIQIAGYMIGLIMSLGIVVSMSQLISDFDGHCLLFTDGWWNDATKTMLVWWASPLYCYYVLVVGVIMMIVCCIQICRFLLLRLENRNTSFLSKFLDAAGCVALSGLVLSVAIIVTLGFVKWCDSVTQYFPSCADIAGHAIDKIDMEYTQSFYIELEAAQVGTWGAFSTLVGLGVAATLKLLQHHNQQNAHAVLASEADGERRPLLNSGWPEDGCSTSPDTEA